MHWQIQLCPQEEALLIYDRQPPEISQLLFLGVSTPQLAALQLVFLGFGLLFPKKSRIYDPMLDKLITSDPCFRLRPCFLGCFFFLPHFHNCFLHFPYASRLFRKAIWEANSRSAESNCLFLVWIYNTCDQQFNVGLLPKQVASVHGPC